MSAKHTPGPWHIGTHPLQIESAHGTIVSRVSGAPSNVECIADARLIAAAPELLEALEGAYALAIGHASTYRFTHQLNAPHKTHQAILDKARVAIAKATGGAA